MLRYIKKNYLHDKKYFTKKEAGRNSAESSRNATYFRDFQPESENPRLHAENC